MRYNVDLAIIMELMPLGSLYDILHNRLIPELPFSLQLRISLQASKVEKIFFNNLTLCPSVIGFHLVISMLRSFITIITAKIKTKDKNCVQYRTLCIV